MRFHGLNTFGYLWVLLVLGGCSSSSTTRQVAEVVDPSWHQEEKHLRNIVQITFGGENAEAYFSFDEKRLCFQSKRDGADADRIYTMNLDGSDVQPVSNGKGVTTCSYYYPDGKRVLYASTHTISEEAPPKPDFRKYGGYVWPIHAGYEIFVHNTETGDEVRLTQNEQYDAEATLSPTGDRMVFTSTRDGDLELYSMKLDGTDVKRLTNNPGYDGGGFYSANGEMIVFRANHPTSDEELAEYKRLLREGVVKPSVMEIYVMDALGSVIDQVTDLGVASFAPFFHPSGEWIIFSSNKHDPRGRNFDLYRIRIDGTDLERLTFSPDFDGFPMFNAAGTKLVFASNRDGKEQGETNVFIADWVE